MAGYARFQRARKSSGSRRFYRRSGYSNRVNNFKKIRYTKRLSTEKKYFDKTYQANHSESQTGGPAGLKSSGVTYISNTWGTYSFGASGASVVTSNDMFKGLATGTTARTRIGNKIKVKYVKGAFTFNAAFLRDIHSRGGWINGSFLKGSYLVAKFQIDTPTSVVRLSEVSVMWKDSPLNIK